MAATLTDERMVAPGPAGSGSVAGVIKFERPLIKVWREYCDRATC